MTYDNLEYDPSTKGPLAERYQEIAKYIEFCGKLGDNLLRFCILYFDENSPFYKNRDLDDKRNKCYEAVKSDMETRREVESMGREYKAVALRWFKLHHSYTFTSWWARKVDYSENILYLASPLSSFDDPEKALIQKKTIKANLAGDMAELLNLENSLFKDEKTRALLTKAANESSLSGFAERMAVNFFEEMENNSRGQL